MHKLVPLLLIGTLLLSSTAIAQQEETFIDQILQFFGLQDDKSLQKDTKTILATAIPKERLVVTKTGFDQYMDVTINKLRNNEYQIEFEEL